MKSEKQNVSSMLINNTSKTNLQSEKNNCNFFTKNEEKSEVESSSKIHIKDISFECKSKPSSILLLRGSYTLIYLYIFMNDMTF
jgi:hypothetical protein